MLIKSELFKKDSSRKQVTLPAMVAIRLGFAAHKQKQIQGLLSMEGHTFLKIVIWKYGRG